MEETRVSADMIRGHTDMIVLKILAGSDAYSFEIYSRIMKKTGEAYTLKEVTLYASYKRLEAEGCLESYWGDETRGARRRYYHLTDRGRERFERDLRSWEFTQNIINTLLSD